MPRKILDISLINENKSDLTFFNIDEDETNETLKALKQTYVTTNYKEETILNLQSNLNANSQETSKELKLESYKKYNNALDLANKNYITSAVEMVESALELNPKDVDILNLKGLLTLLKCDFSKAFESFYTGLCYGNNELSRKYVDLLSSEEYNTFLARYNHSIRFINEELNHESIQILDNMIIEDENLIEPYVLLALLYEKLGNIKKKEIYMDRLKQMDKDNPIFNDKSIEQKEGNMDEKVNVKDKTKKKNIIPYAIIGCLVIGIGVFAIQYKNKMDNLSSKLSEKEEQLSVTDKELNEANQKLDETSKVLDETSKVLDEKNKELDEEKNKKPEKEVVLASEETLYNNALQLRAAQNYEGAISYFEKVVQLGKTKKYKAESMYQLGILNEKIGNKDEAAKYYKKYIYTYDAKDQYYDDAYYQLGMIYYNNGELQKAKDTFYGMKSEVPDSIYNNSTVAAILKK